jgi:hypothetical protein
MRPALDGDSFRGHRAEKILQCHPCCGDPSFAHSIACRVYGNQLRAPVSQIHPDYLHVVPIDQIPRKIRHGQSPFFAVCLEHLDEFCCSALYCATALGGWPSHLIWPGRFRGPCAAAIRGVTAAALRSLWCYHQSRQRPCRSAAGV